MRRFLLCLSLFLALPGCKKLEEKLTQRAADKAVEMGTGGEMKVETRGGDTTVTDKQTGTTVTGGAALAVPKDWPAKVPLYPGATIRSVLATGGTKSVTLATKDTPAKVTDFYKTKSGLTVDSEMDLGAQRILMLKNGKSDVNVTIGAAGAETMVKLMIIN